MPTLTITLPPRHFQRVKARARREGFRSPTKWAELLIERNLELEESPCLEPEKIVARMKKTGFYRSQFLRELKASLAYADKTAERTG